jgi:predicted transcriptional regulator
MCRKCVEEEIILTGLPKEIFEDVESRLVNVGFLKRKERGVKIRYKVTSLGIAASSTMTKASMKDADFRVFLQKVEQADGKK